MITLLEKWRHTGFNVFFGQRILPRQGKPVFSTVFFGDISILCPGYYSVHERVAWQTGIRILPEHDFSFRD
jgi:hypothetical protein